MSVRVPRLATAAVWAATDPVLEYGEPGRDTTNGVDRVGNGVSRWSQLSNYAGTDLATAPILPTGVDYEFVMIDSAKPSGLRTVRPVSTQYISDAITSLPTIFPTTNITGQSSGTIKLAYVTADKDITIGNLTMYTSSTAAAATPTLCRMGIYSVAANGDLTRIGACASDTALFAAANTGYTRALASPTTVALTHGTRYAFAFIVVSAATMPSMSGIFIIQNECVGNANTGPRSVGAVTGQTDLPSSIVNASVVNTGTFLYHRAQ